MNEVLGKAQRGISGPKLLCLFVLFVEGGTKNTARELKLYKLNSILRRHYGFIMTVSWEKIYSVLDGVAKRRSPVRNIFSPDAIIIKPQCRLKIEFSFFLSRSMSFFLPKNYKLEQ